MQSHGRAKRLYESLFCEEISRSELLERIRCRYGKQHNIYVSSSSNSCADSQRSNLRVMSHNPNYDDYITQKDWYEYQ